MNEIFLANTARVRWFKSQEIYQILQNPPKGFIVTKMPTKPNHGELFILDSKATKRKWKQDGWTYLPRKQGVGFREDNENLRIGGENAITCYYSYIISGLLEGEEKTILMNRRIYKLFPEGQYFLVHYLSDSSIEQPPAKEIKSNEEEISQRVRSEDSQNSIAQSNQLFHSNEIKSDSVNQHQVFPQYSDESSYYSVPTQQAGKSNSDTKAELISQRQNSHEGKSSSTDEAASQDVHIDEEKEFQQLEILNGVNNECNLNNNHNNVSMFPNTYEYNNNNYDLWNNPHNAEKKKYQSDQQDMFSCINNYSELPAFCGTSGNNDGQSCEDNYPYTFYTGQSQHITCCNPHAGGDPIKMEFKENLMSFANSLSSQNMNYQNDHMLSNNGNIMSLHPSYQQPLSLLDGDQSSKIVNINEQQQYFNGNELQQHEQSNGNNQPSYSKLQERIVELEQRLMKLEFDKKSLQQSEINNSKISGDIPYFEHQQQQQYNGGMILSEQSSIQTITSASNQPLFQYQQNQFRLNNESDLQIQDTVIFNHGITQPHYNENKNLEQIDVSLVSQVDSSSNSLLMQQQQRQVPNEDNPNNSQPKQKPQIKVTEYSPEWDYTKGGSKMVLCFLPVLSELSDDERGTFQIGFGVQKVPAYCIQPGVLKCFVPPQEKGLVKLSIFLSDQRVDDVLDKTNYFEYRSQEKKKKPKQNVKRIVFNQEDELYRNEFKVRIIDKLNSISEFINQSGSKSSSTSKQSKISKINESVITETPQKATETPQKSTEIPQKVSETPPQNLNQIEDLLLNELKMDINKLDKSSFEKILKKVLQVADGKLKKNQIKKWLDEVDENGYGLIHYVIILGFDTTLPILIEQDCNLRLQSKNSITPLELALALNQEKTAEILIKNGVLETRMGEDRQSQEGDNRGENDSHKILNFNDIFKSRNILDMLVREVTLHDSINNSSFNEHMSWNDQDQEEDNYFELKDLCESTNEKDMIQAQLRQLGKKLASCSLKDGRLFSEDDDDEEDEEEDEDEDDDEEDDEEEEEEGDEDQFNSQLNNWQRQLVNANKDKDKKIRKTLSHDNIDKIQSKKHKYLRNYSELKIKTKKVKQQQNKQEDNQSEQIGLGFQDMSDEMYQNSNYQCRIKTIQKNVRGWLLRRQYLDIKYATRVLQNYIRQKIAKKHIKPECKSMIKNKLIDWLSIKH